MRRIFIYVIFIICAFFYQTSNSHVLAVPSYQLYTYDIGRVEIVNGTFKIYGWAYLYPPICWGSDLSCNRGATHNVNPKFTMKLVTDTKTGEVKSKDYIDKASKPAYSAKYTQPNDYTRAFFTRISGITYPDINPAAIAGWKKVGIDERAEVIKKTSSPSVGIPSFFAININFIFEIPIKDIKDMALKSSSNPKEVSLELNIDIKGGNIKVYGSTFNQADFETTIPIEIKEKSFAEDALPLLEAEGLSFDGFAGNQVTVIGERAHAIASPHFNYGNYYYVTPQGKISNGTDAGPAASIYFHSWSGLAETPKGSSLWVVSVYGWDFVNQRATYTISDIVCSDTALPATHDPYLCFYKTKISLDNDISCNTGYCAIDNTNSIYEAYIPPFWALPSRGTISVFKIGGAASIPTINVPCSQIKDPMLKYCCQNPTDSSVCSAKGIYPEGIPSAQNKANTCSDNKTKKIEFKYRPTLASDSATAPEIYSKNVLSNSACRIGCKEEVDVTVQPGISSLKAGMGFTYPVKIESSRYCVAAYDNVGWNTKLDTAANTANTNYPQIFTASDKAIALDNACGEKVEVFTNFEKCSKSGYTCTLNGYKCNCTNKITGKTTSSTAKCPDGYERKGTTCRKYVCSINTKKSWDEAQNEINDQLNKATDYLNKYDQAINTIDSLFKDRDTCDDWTDQKSTKYKGASDTKITTTNVPYQTEYKVTSSKSSEDGSFSKSRKKNATSYVIQDVASKVKYNPINFSSRIKSKVSKYKDTYNQYNKIKTVTYNDFWSKKDDVDLELNFKEKYYIQRYTGEPSTKGGDGYDEHGYYAYTGFNDMSGKHDFSLAITNLGPNLPTLNNNLWSINPLTCNYNVNNLIFPPQGDKNYNKYGSPAFMYRQISLTDPFPNRNPGENWEGKSSLITSNGYKIYSNAPKYTIELTPTLMKEIRNYGTNYGDFYVKDPYQSKVIDKYQGTGAIMLNKR